MIDFSDFILAESYIAHSEYDLKQKYDIYNRTLFQGALPEIPVQWFDSRNRAGLTTYRLRKQPGMLPGMDGGQMVPGTLQMFVSKRFKNTEQDLDSTVIHEMLHVYFAVNGMHSENHGLRFQAKAHELSHKVGFLIPLTDDLTNKEVSDDRRPREIGVVLVHRGGDNYVASLLNINQFRTMFDKIFDFWHKRFTSKHERTWLLTVTTTLAHKFPIARNVDKPPMYRVTPVEAAALLKGDVIEEFA